MLTLLKTIRSNYEINVYYIINTTYQHLSAAILEFFLQNRGK